VSGILKENEKEKYIKHENKIKTLIKFIFENNKYFFILT
jgi:hypothetical protein